MITIKEKNTKLGFDTFLICLTLKLQFASSKQNESTNQTPNQNIII